MLELEIMNYCFLALKQPRTSIYYKLALDVRQILDSNRKIITKNFGCNKQYCNCKAVSKTLYFEIFLLRFYFLPLWISNKKAIIEANIDMFRILFHHTSFGNYEITGTIGYKFIQRCTFLLFLWIYS